MKLKIFALIMIVLLGCKSTGQIPKPPIILVTSDGSLIADTALSHSWLKTVTPLIATQINDTVVFTIDMPKLISMISGTTPVPSTIPRFQTVVATAGQTQFTFVMPLVYFVFKNGLLISKNKAYTVQGNVITILSPARANDEIKVVRLE